MTLGHAETEPSASGGHRDVGAALAPDAPRTSEEALIITSPLEKMDLAS